LSYVRVQIASFLVYASAIGKRVSFALLIAEGIGDLRADTQVGIQRHSSKDFVLGTRSNAVFFK